MTKQTVTAFFDDRETANNAVLLLRRFAIPDKDVTISPEAAATGFAEAMPAHVSRFWHWMETLFGGIHARHVYAESVRRGSVMVTAHVDDAQVENVVAVLERHGSVDVNARTSVWQAEGWTGGPAGNRETADPDLGLRCATSPTPQAQAEQAAASVLAAASAVAMYRTPSGTVTRGTVHVHAHASRAPRDGDANRVGDGAAADDGTNTQGWPQGVNNREPGRSASSAKVGHAAAAQPAKDLEVVGSDGETIGTIDYVEGTTIKLKRVDPVLFGTHHLIPTEWVRSIDDKVMLKLTAAEAKSRWMVG